MLGDIDGANWAEAVTGIFTFAIALGVGLAWIQLRDARKTRDAEIVQHLMELWDSARMVEARRLIASYRGSGAIQRMAVDFTKSRDRQTGDYFLFTYHLNFWEQVSQAFGRNRRALKIIWVMFGDNFTHAWITWDAVIKTAYLASSDVGSAFKTAIRKLERRNRRRVYRREFWLWLSTPYYQVDPEERTVRRRSWVVG